MRSRCPRTAPQTHPSTWTTCFSSSQSFPVRAKLLGTVGLELVPWHAKLRSLRQSTHHRQTFDRWKMRAGGESIHPHHPSRGTGLADMQFTGLLRGQSHFTAAKTDSKTCVSPTAPTSSKGRISCIENLNPESPKGFYKFPPDQHWT